MQSGPRSCTEFHWLQGGDDLKGHPGIGDYAGGERGACGQWRAKVWCARTVLFM